jgi:hypothetical protein
MFSLSGSLQFLQNKCVWFLQKRNGLGVPRYKIAGSAMQDRRKVQRTSVLKNAKLVLNNCSSLFDCTVLNLTNVGSCISLTSPICAHDSFELTFDHALSSRTCHVIWRSENKVGVSFGREREALSDKHS